MTSLISAAIQQLMGDGKTRTPQLDQTTGITWVPLQKVEAFIPYSTTEVDEKETLKRIQYDYNKRIRVQGRWGDFIDEEKDRICHYESSNPLIEGEILHATGNGFYKAFHDAWAQHGKIIISPDDVWIVIQLQMAQYIEKNAETLRSIFVNHEGKKELSVGMDDVGMNWPIFMERVIDQIKKNTNNNTEKDFIPRFSSSTLLQMNLKNLAVMDCMKSYFEYTMSLCCGIESVGFIGSFQDWELLLETVKNLKKFIIKKTKPHQEIQYFNDFEGWINQLIMICTNFLETYQGKNVDLDFWNKVIQQTQTFGSGGSIYIEGWITVLLTNQYKKRMDVADIPSSRFNVDVKIDDNGNISNTKIIGGFTGLYYNQEKHTFRPQCSLAVLKLDDPLILKEAKQKELDDLVDKLDEVAQNKDSTKTDINVARYKLSDMKDIKNKLGLIQKPQKHYKE